MQKLALSAGTSSGPTSLDEIAEFNDFTVITSKKKQSKIKIKPIIKETANNTALPSSPTLESHVSASSEHNKKQFLAASTKAK
jgi:hypothetical protein